MTLRIILLNYFLFSKLIFERNRLPENCNLRDILGSSIKSWGQTEMSASMSGYISSTLGEYFISILLTPSAEKDWNQLLMQLVHARDLS